MKKLISAVTSLCMAATMVSVVAPSTVGAADTAKGFAVKTYDADKPSSADGKSTVTIDKKDIPASGYTFPAALYYSEESASTTSFLVHLTTDSSAITFPKVYEPDQPYFSAEKEQVMASGTASTDCYVSFGGQLSKRGKYSAAGLAKFGLDSSQSAAGTDNYFLGCSWMNMGEEYTWAGAKSDSFPVYVFDVNIPATIAAGTYHITYCKYDTDPDPANEVMAPMAEAKTNDVKSKYNLASNNLKLEEMTIVVTENGSTPGTTTTVTQPPVTTTTTVGTVTPGDKDFNFKFVDDKGNSVVSANPGDEITVCVQVDAGNNTCAGMDVQFSTSGLAIDEFENNSEACGNAKLAKNEKELRANFTSTGTDGEPMKVSNGKDAFTFYVTIPATAKDTSYTIGFVDGELNVFKEGGTGSKYTAGYTPLTINVGTPNPGTTTTVTQPPVTTTTTTGGQTSNADFKFSFVDDKGQSTVNAKAGDEITVCVQVDAGNNTCAGMDVQFSTSGLAIDEFENNSEACGNAKLAKNEKELRANFTSTGTDGEPMKVSNGKDAFTFYVTIPSDAKDTSYVIGFVDSELKVFKEGGTGDKYSASYTPLTINVGTPSGTTTTTVTQPPVTTTTTGGQTSNAEFKFSFVDDKDQSAINVNAGDEVTVCVKVDAGNNTCAGMDVQFSTSGLAIDEFENNSEACGNAKLAKNEKELRANFTSTGTDGEPMKVSNGKDAFTFYVTIPATAKDGDSYVIGFVDSELKVFKEGGTGDKYTASYTPLTITVGKQPVTTSTTTTTVTTTSTTTTTVTTPQPGTKLVPTWGDTNCDGVVNVADVVVLNRFLNDPTYSNITDQGKVNADVVDPQDKSGAAVDPAGVKLTVADSEAILKAIVELITLPQ